MYMQQAVVVSDLEKLLAMQILPEWATQAGKLRQQIATLEPDIRVLGPRPTKDQGLISPC